jgi:hypothetical protein
MTYRSLYLLSALGCALVGTALVLAIFSEFRETLRDLLSSRILAALTLLALVGAIFFLIRAFVPPPDDRGSSCLKCGKWIGHLNSPVFGREFRCPSCKGAVAQQGSLAQLAASAPPGPRLRAVEFEIAPAEGNPGPAVSVDALRSALAHGDEFTVEEDDLGRLVLVARDGILRAQADPDTGELGFARDQSRLTFHLPEGVGIKPQEIVLRSDSSGLVEACCRQLPRSLGPIKVRVKGAADWVSVDEDSPTWGVQLMRQFLGHPFPERSHPMRHLGRFGTFVVSLAILAGLSAGPAAAAPPADSASASPRLKYLPKDYWAVVECDCGTVMKFMNSEGAQRNPQYAQFRESLRLVKTFSAIDPEKDVDWITLFVTGSPGEKSKVLLAVQGSFKNDIVAKRLSSTLADSIREKTYKKQTIYSIPSASLWFPEASTLVAGDDGLVREAIDRQAAGARRVPEGLQSVLDRTPGKSVVWAAVRPEVILEHEELADWRKGNGDFYRALKKLDCVSLSFDVADDGLLITGLGHVTGDGGAKKLYQYLSDRKKNLLHQEGSNVLFTTLLILCEIRMSGPHIEGSFRLTGQAFKELWETKVIVRPGTPSEGPKGR